MERGTQKTSEIKTGIPAKQNIKQQASRYMKIKFLLKASLALAMALALNGNATAQNSDFRTQAGELIHKGEMKKAEKLLKALPKSVREANPFAIDSLHQIIYRIRNDFRLDPKDGRAQIEKRMGTASSDEKFNYWKKKRYIEADTLDGKEWWFRRAVGNFFLLNREDFKTQNANSKKSTYNYYAKFYNEAMLTPADNNNLRDPHRWQITFNLTVDANAVPAGETIRVWLPYPMETLRQTNVKVLKSSAPYTVSQGTFHHTAYMEAVAEKDKKADFSITYSFVTQEQHYTRAEIMSRLKPYDTSTAVYQEYTSDQAPHIIKSAKLTSLAKQIVGNEKNPVMQASMVYDWIASNFPWAGAREYSTIANIPEYVIENGHGDCGQVALLYITLMRCLGIPARWESGFMLHPGEENYHDWAETYFEGVGWVPTDESFGRSMIGEDLSDYYKTGIDLYRFVVNKGVNGDFYPKKNYIRSETVDNQAGEVEWRGGNLEYKDWDSHLQVDSCIKINLNQPETSWALTKLSVASMRTHGAHSAEMATQSVMGTPLRILEKDGDWYKAETPEGYTSYIPGSSIQMLDSAKFLAWKQAKRYIVTVYQSQLTATPDGETVSDLLLGNILEYKGKKGKYIQLATPDGRVGWVAASDVEELQSWAARPFSTLQVVATAKRMMGSPYFWGGTSTKMTDCSGLSKICYLSSGVILRRDAWQQALTGEKIAAADWKSAQEGDLFFFGNSKGRVTHVAISLGGDKYIHCSGRVKINSVDPQASDYLSTPFLSISRINGKIGTDGITAVKDHPWFF